MALSSSDLATLFQKDTEHSKCVCSLLTCCRYISVSSTNKSCISFCLVSSSSRWCLLFISGLSFFFTVNFADASVFFFLDLCKHLSVRKWPFVMVAAHWGGATIGWVARQEAAATRSSVCVTSESEEMRQQTSSPTVCSFKSWVRKYARVEGVTLPPSEDLCPSGGSNSPAAGARNLTQFGEKGRYKRRMILH